MISWLECECGARYSSLSANHLIGSIGITMGSVELEPTTTRGLSFGEDLVPQPEACLRFGVAAIEWTPRYGPCGSEAQGDWPIKEKEEEITATWTNAQWRNWWSYRVKPGEELPDGTIG